MDYQNRKCLVAYFSRSGQNYVNGNITELPVGNTALLAEVIRGLVQGDSFHIETVDAYPLDYTKTTEIAQNQLRRNARPELTRTVCKMQGYDTIFLGYPNWWGTMPMAVWTFLEAYDFSGKTIVPFCTHEGSGLGRSEQDIEKLCSSAHIAPGLAIKGGRLQEMTKKTLQSTVQQWLQQ
jgi:flavodoxin